MATLSGSINLTKIPKECFKKVTMKDGTTAVFLNIRIGKRKNPVEFGGKTIDHYVSCAPKKDERVEGVNYFIGDLSEWTDNPQPKGMVSTETVYNAPVADDDDLPF